MEFQYTVWWGVFSMNILIYVLIYEKNILKNNET